MTENLRILKYFTLRSLSWNLLEIQLKSALETCYISIPSLLVYYQFDSGSVQARCTPVIILIPLVFGRYLAFVSVECIILENFQSVAF